jgi:oxygen-independent coproporphyrinogen III oxidase
VRSPERFGAAEPGTYFSVLPRHLYVHVPFCARRCVYCDFSIAVRRDVPVDEYVAAIERELEIRFADSERSVVSTLYLGGGTPSRLGAAGVSRLLDVLRSRIDVAPDGEVTLEANPDDVTPDAARAWRNAGVNRLSVGAQSFDDAALAWMHRTHDAAQIGRAVDAARSAGIEDVSVDLIFSLPENLRRSWADDLEHALALEPTHVVVRPHHRAAHAAWPVAATRRGG